MTLPKDEKRLREIETGHIGNLTLATDWMLHWSQAAVKRMQRQMGAEHEKGLAVFWGRKLVHEAAALEAFHDALQASAAPEHKTFRENTRLKPFLDGLGQLTAEEKKQPFALYKALRPAVLMIRDEAQKAAPPKNNNNNPPPPAPFRPK